MPLSADIVIVGGGFVGLSVAWHLAQAGAAVTVLERQTLPAAPETQATMAAAGMLAPLAEARAPGVFLEWGLECLRQYPAWSAQVQAESGLDPEYIGGGMLRVALTDAEEATLCETFRWQAAQGLAAVWRVEWLTGAAARRLEPALSPQVVGAVFSPEEKQIDPRRLHRALYLACRRRGVTIREGCPVTGLLTEKDRVTAVRTPLESFACGQVLLAGGAWSAAAADWLGVHVPVAPVRGQMIVLRPESLLHHTVYGVQGYLVPRADGRLLVGATEEDAGFAARTTAAGIATLLIQGAALVPALSDAPFDTAWAGLRPATPNHLPLLGRLPGWQNAFLATGHFRNGILFAPLTGQRMADALLHDVPLPAEFQV